MYSCCSVKVGSSIDGRVILGSLAMASRTMASISIRYCPEEIVVGSAFLAREASFA